MVIRVLCNHKCVFNTSLHQKKQYEVETDAFILVLKDVEDTLISFFFSDVVVDSKGSYPAGIWCKNDVVLTSMRRDDVASTLIRRHFRTKCPLGTFRMYLLKLMVCPANQPSDASPYCNTL